MLSAAVVDDNGVIFYASDKTFDRPVSGRRVCRLRSPDVPVVCPLVNDELPHIFPAPLRPLYGHITGFAFNIYNNIWDTNYIMWYPYHDRDADFRARFYVDV